MAGWWRALVRAAQRHPWPTNVVLYTTLFSAGDVLQQRLRGGPADWRQTGRVATLAVTFQANFSYMWLRLLERALPGRTPRAILAKVVCDQMVGGPVALSIFYTGMSVLQGKDDIFGDLKKKFWNTYMENCDQYMNAKSGSVNVTTKNVLNLKGFVTTPQPPQDSAALMYWPFVQLVNFSLVPIQWRTTCSGLSAFLWATFLCYSQQSGDGTLKSVFTFLHSKEANAVERHREK